MRDVIETESGQVVIVNTEPDESVSLAIGRSGVYILACLTTQEARAVRAMLLEANRDVAATRVKNAMKPGGADGDSGNPRG